MAIDYDSLIQNVTFIVLGIFIGYGFRLIYISIFGRSTRIERENKEEVNAKKTTFFDLFKNTPMIYIKSLSEITGCHIYAKCEYFLPYTSKDRMIKNIIETSIK